MFDLLPAHVRERAREAYRLFQENPGHPSLHFERLGIDADLWSVRITLHSRAVARRKGDTLAWFWIGRHADFDRDFG